MVRIRLLPAASDAPETRDQLKIIVIVLAVINLPVCDIQNLTALNIVKPFLILRCPVLCLIKDKNESHSAP